MTNEIKLTTSPGAILQKALTPGYQFRMVDAVQGEFAAINTPKLLTILLSPSLNTHMGKSFIYDVETAQAQLMNGKSYSEGGKKFTQDLATQASFAIPSFGGAFSVNCQDYAEKRKPNSTELMDEEYVVAKQTEKMMAAMDLVNELGVAQVITSDSNLLLSGPGASYDYSSVLTGSSRAAAETIAFASATRQTLREQIENAIDEKTDELASIMKSASGWVLVAGKNVFSAIYGVEAAVDNPRELRTQDDFASMGMPRVEAGDFSNFRAFEHSSGAMVVKYTANILGTKLIGDNSAYLIPMGVENMLSIELAPAATRDSVNKDAEPLYMWVEEDRRGIYFEFETNRLFFNRNPQLIKAFTGTYA